MEEVITIKKVDETYNKVVADPSIVMEMNDHFTFEVPGAKFMPAVRNKVWDGKIRLLNAMTCQIYAGLNKYIEEFSKTRGYTVNYEYDVSLEEFSLKEANDFIDTLSIPSEYERRDYQVQAFAHAVRHKRALMLSPTSSGKSMMIYIIY